MPWRKNIQGAIQQYDSNLILWKFSLTLILKYLILRIRAEVCHQGHTHEVLLVLYVHSLLFFLPNNFHVQL